MFQYIHIVYVYFIVIFLDNLQGVGCVSMTIKVAKTVKAKKRSETINSMLI